PILHRKIQRGKDGSLSAGRVQSVALKLVVDREKEIEAFNAVEYWNIFADLQPSPEERIFRAQLFAVDGKKVEKEKTTAKEVYLIENEETAKKLVERLNNGTYTVANLQKKEKKRNPVPPFITSTLQQEASRHYGFSASRTMGIAQSLYEGVDLGPAGSEGLITYMRTDSVRLAPEALAEARSFVEKTYGKEYLPEKPRQYSSKSGAQDAHEAIRPTSVNYPPSLIDKYLTRDQQKLYLLVWRRFLASQMNPAIYDTVTCDIDTAQEMMFRATGSVIKFPGFLAVYEEKEDTTNDTKSDDKILPKMEEGQKLTLIELEKNQSFTRPPPRYTEASLVKELEKQGIGRPSTYASIMNKIQSRAYTEKERLNIIPTELGRVITQLLEENFTDIMNPSFTARMEGELDEIAEHKLEWKSFLKTFWSHFIPLVDAAIESAHVPKVGTDITCPQCKEGKLQKIWSRNKYFYGCDKYPDCSFACPMEALNFDRSEYAENFDWDQSCPKCKKPMTLRHGRFGAFLGCSGYPDCNGIVNIPKKDDPNPEDLPQCPAIDCPGRLVQRRSRFGKPFFSCSTYPDCDVIGNSAEQVLEKYNNHPRT
ncbi:MAG: type I DNA topoisomerase, partial [Simkaniaceae bacterium]|nr:type I DNA topoisomerase [Simkaniaceae bacterium]